MRPWNRFRQDRSRASTVSVALPSLKPRAWGARITGISTVSPRPPPGGKVRSATTLLWSPWEKVTLTSFRPLLRSPASTVRPVLAPTTSTGVFNVTVGSSKSRRPTASHTRTATTHQARRAPEDVPDLSSPTRFQHLAHGCIVSGIGPGSKESRGRTSQDFWLSPASATEMAHGLD